VGRREHYTRLHSHLAPLAFTDHPIFNIGSGRGVSIRDILTLLEDRLGRTLQVRYLASRQFAVTINVLDIQQARSILGWAPKLEFSAGMGLMISDYRAGRSNYSTLLSAGDTEGVVNE